MSWGKDFKGRAAATAEEATYHVEDGEDVKCCMNSPL